MDWIGAIVESIRDLQCPNCGARLASCGVRGITAESNALVVRLACSICGENSVALVRRDRPELADPITCDDVLDAHEFFARWDGRVAQLLASDRAA